MRWVAKPNLNNNTGMMTFDSQLNAVAYLEAKTGHKMEFVKDKKTGKRVYDWELIGKLYPVNDNDCPPPVASAMAA